MVTQNPDLPDAIDRETFLHSLHPEHPRLFADRARWEVLRNHVESTELLRGVHSILRRAAGDVMDSPPLERVFEGRRLLAVSRGVLKRVLTFGTLFRLGGEARLRDRLKAEVLNAAGFSDWNPSHFLDTAEMTLALAVAYDWLYDEWSEEERATVRNAIVDKGLRAGRGPLGWKSSDTNWNQVCYAGMIAGALAVGEDEPELAVEFLNELAGNAHLPLDACLPEGAYPEGPGYWSYGMHFQVMLLSVLESALGTTLGIAEHAALKGSPVFINVVTGPSGRYFNYADGSARVNLKPALHWFAARTANPALDADERERLRAAAHSQNGLLFPAAGAGDKERFLPLALLWLDPELEGSKPESGLPLHWHGKGVNPIAVHRSSWENDAVFVGIKGGSPSVNHGHMDVGSFVLDAKGVRWAIDLGAQDYHSVESLGMKLWDRRQESDRWRVFRLGAYSHNTLVIDGKQQVVDGYAPIIAFSGKPDDPYSVVDMSRVYGGAIDRAIRGVRFLPGEGVMIHDLLEGLGAGREVRWAMLTCAQIELDGDRATLMQAGEELYARILDPAGASFAIAPSDPPPNAWDTPNPGTRMLVFSVSGTPECERSCNLRVALTLAPLSDVRVDEFRKRDLPAVS